MFLYFKNTSSLKYRAVSDMGLLLLKLFQVSVYIAVMVVVAGLISAAEESTLLIHFERAPPVRTRFTSAVFLYTIKRVDGYNACKNDGCSIHCELDGQILRECPAHGVVFRNLTVNSRHNFLLNITTRDGRRNSSDYSWFIDTIRPTATIFTQQIYTSAKKIAIDVTFSETCTGNGGFKCVNSSNCDVLVDGPALVQASSLHMIKPKLKYSLNLILSSAIMYARVVVRMADKFCTDEAGNHFTRTNGSIIIVHLDRRPVQGDLWTPIPSYVLGINGVPRTVLATNKGEDLDIFLDFHSPISNSTEQILSALRVNSGNLVPINGQNHGNHRFGFRLKNILRTDIITVELQAASVIGRTGAHVSPVSPLTFLYDSSNPGVVLSTSSPSVTKKSDINVIVEFTKPVFGFEASMVMVDGGRLTRFEGLSRALYSLTILAVPQSVVSIIVPAGKVNDISGNLNLASNRLEVEHYSVPAISLALHSFVTAGVLATSFAASVFALSSANREAVGTLATRSIKIVASSPSTNLHGMVGHLQVFVLSDWLSDSLPIEYSETTKGLRWLIPRQNLPWNKESTSMWPNHFYVSKENIAMNFSGLSIGYPSRGRPYHSVFLNSTNSSCLHELLFPTENDSKSGWLHGHYNMSMKTSPYGLPLDSKEYFIYFLRGEPMSASNVVKRMENYKGWEDMEMNLFWLGVGGGSLLLIHYLILLFLRWRTRTPSNGILSVPRFELFLLILMLPCISQSSAFVMRGGTTGGIITGAMLLAIPAALILSASLFLIIVVFSGKLVQYKEVQHRDGTESWCTKLSVFFVGTPTTGKWFYNEGLPSFLQRFGILFESRKGPPLYVFIDPNDPTNMPKWIESGESGVGRMRAVSSEDSNEEPKVPMSEKLFGCAKSSYVIFDLLRRVSLGIISGAYSTRQSSQSLFALIITLVQFLYLFTLKPYIRRGIHVVECVSLLSEAGIFGISIWKNGSNPMKERTLGFVMLALFFLTFVSHTMNEWYALIKAVLRLSQPQKDSFKLGLKCAAKGLILPFIPRKHWSSIIPKSSQPSTGLVPVIPLSPETELERRRGTRMPHGDPFSAMTATVVPMLSPGSPSPNVIQTTGSTTTENIVSVQREGEGKRLKGLKLEQESELKKLRELAKASFSRFPKGEEGSTSYGSKVPTEFSSLKHKH